MATDDEEEGRGSRVLQVFSAGADPEFGGGDDGGDDDIEIRLSALGFAVDLAGARDSGQYDPVAVVEAATLFTDFILGKNKPS